MIASITLVACEEALQSEAQRLASRLGLPLAHKVPAQGLILEYRADGLALRDAGAPREQPLRVDFTKGAMGYRHRQGIAKNELLARAAGIKGGSRPSVLDATAGLGRDAFLLASLGCEVTMLERHPVVYALLEDGMRRAFLDPRLRPVIERMHLLAADAMRLPPDSRGFDVVVLDPMFPQRNKSALVKKPMRLFHELVGQDDGADAMLDRLRSLARKRVVVKRPLHALQLAGCKPDVIYRGKAVRFDVYLQHG